MDKVKNLQEKARVLRDTPLKVAKVGDYFRRLASKPDRR
jgi:hypothetical protein